MQFFKTQPAEESGSLNLGGREVLFTVIRNSRRRRGIAFRIEPDLRLRVMAPPRTRLSAIHHMLLSRSGWIAQHMARLQMATPALPRRCQDGATIRYLGHDYHLRITQDATPQRCRVTPRRFLVNLPDHDLSEDALQEEARLEILLWLKKRAKVKLQKRLDIWAEKLNLRYSSLAIGNPKRQWGSCSSGNAIRLSWRLIMAPLPLIDYVVVHELCHITHKNHGPRFWRTVAQAMPDYQARRVALRQMGRDLLLD
ncbi:MAG: SprT family zinc-dependent metalloprotease [Alphaproteobacteria bacterium]|nr:SprT family zinc-dependent metalloprotease [Alphaproteobacteria bacterium]